MNNSFNFLTLWIDSIKSFRNIITINSSGFSQHTTATALREKYMEEIVIRDAYLAKKLIFYAEGPTIVLIFSLSKYENQSLKPGIGESVPKCLIFGNSS